MIVLAFDTCFAAVDVAVARNGVIVAHASERVSGGHGERLMPAIEASLADAGVNFSDVDRIAVTLGPGGFTGLRVGLAVARALALAAARPLVGMSSLELLARTAVAYGLVGPGCDVLATTDARKDMLYAARYDSSAVALRTEPTLSSIGDLLRDHPEPGIVAIGFGGGLLADASAGRIEARAPDLLPDARVLAAAAPHLTPLTEPRPLYLRAADAKPQTGKSLPRAS